MKTFTVFYLSTRGEFKTFRILARSMKEARRISLEEMRHPVDYAEFIGIEAGEVEL